MMTNLRVCHQQNKEEAGLETIEGTGGPWAGDKKGPKGIAKKKEHPNPKGGGNKFTKKTGSERG